MKRLIGIALVVTLAAVCAFGQTNQRRKGPLADRTQGRKGDQNKPPAGGGSYVLGKNYYNTVVDGDQREYYVHVPKSYNKAMATPVVFMLHGTSGDGLKFYNISGWKELGEAENILTVYPSSWRHCIIENGEKMNTTKWNIYPGSFEYCPGQVPKNDIKFLNQVIDEMVAKFNVDQKMIYFVGFSNGGQMTARVGVEMSDRVAAVVSSAGNLQAGTSYTPKRLLPNLFQFGSNDDRYMPAFGGQPAPMDFKLLMANTFLKGVMSTYTKTYQLGTQHRNGGDPNKLIWLEVKGTSGKPENVFRIAVIKDMTHLYPNGENFPLYGAQMNWQWLKQFKLP